MGVGKKVQPLRRVATGWQRVLIADLKTNGSS